MSSDRSVRVPSMIGLLHASWSAFELSLEILARDLLRITDVQAHIVFSSLGVKAKQEICISLLKESDRANQEDIVRSIREVFQIATRNHIFHSIILVNEPKWTHVRFLKREVANGFVIKEKGFADDELRRKTDEVADAAIRFQELAGIANDGLLAYAKTAEDFAQALNVCASIE